MFSRRPGFSSAARPVGAPVPSSDATGDGASSQKRWKKLTAVALAAATVVPPSAFAMLARTAEAAMSNAVSNPQTPPAPLAVSSLGASVEAGELELLAPENETLRLATEQFRAGEFEEAQATLAGVKADDLSASDRRALDRLSKRVAEAVDGRKAARAGYEKGEALLAEGKLSDAIKEYRSAADSRYADSATRTKALEQIALAEAQRKSAEVADRAAYAEARELLAKGELDAAKTKLQALSDRGYRPGLFQRSPQELLGEIARRQGVPPVAATPEAPVAPATPSAEVPAAPAAPEVPANVGPTGKDFYVQGVDQFRNKDFVAAKKSFEAARAAGYRAGLFERSPADYLTRIDRELAAAVPATPAVVEVPATPAAPVAPAAPAVVETPAAPAAPVAPAAPAAPAVVATPEAPAAQQTPAVTVTPANGAQTPEVPAAPANTELAKQAYDDGVRQFRAGELDAAEKSFGTAKELGHKAGMFQDSPDRWLTRIADRRTELANEEKAAAQRAAEQAEKQTSDSKRAEARAAYVQGRDLYRKGDWIEARKFFVQANELGYRPGLFEDSAIRFLERMDRKEQADAAKHAAELAAAQPAAPEAPVTPAPVAPPAAPAVVEAPVVPAAPAAPETPAAPAVAAQVDNAAKAREVVAQARAAQAAGDNVKALELYTQASVLDPANAQAVAGRDELAAAARPAPGLLGDQERAILGRRQVVQYNFDQAIGLVRERTATGDFAGARQAMEQARAARNTDPTIFSNAEMARFDTEISATQTALDQASAARAKLEAEQAAAQQVQAEREKANSARSERERTVSSLIKQARTLIDEAKFAEAINVLDQILAIDPQNDYAQGVRPLIEDKAMIQQQRRYREEYGRQLAKQFSRAQEIQVPYDDLMRYPENWPDIVESRDADAAERKGEVLIDPQTQAIFDRIMPELSLVEIPFGDVIKSLEDISGATIVPDWKTLEGAGIDKTTVITVQRLRNQKFQRVLELVLRQVSGGTEPIDYFVKDGVIEISTVSQIGQASTLAVYDVSDLTFRPLDVEPPDPPSANFQLEAVTRGGGGGGGSPFQGTGGGAGQGNDDAATPDEILDELIEIIQELVTPTTWSSGPQGAGSSTIRRFQAGSARTLIVNAPQRTHMELEKLLSKLRASQAVQVSIEARFLQVRRSFLEDIGLDIDVDLNRGGVISPRLGSRTGPNGSFANNLPIRQNSSSFTTNPRSGLPTVLQDVSTDTSPAFSIQGTFLDDFSVDFLLRATQASATTSTAQAPRLTLFSGQSAIVVVGTYEFFVTELNPIVGTQAVAFEPEPTPVFSGVQLWVHAVVSSDRKYVQLNLVPGLLERTAVATFAVQAAITLTDDGGGGGGGTSPPGQVTPVNGIATAFIQLPTQALTMVYTSASVPDGGTVLLGGLTQGGESSKEMGVPVLSKIPFLKRLFTNTSSAKDENVVLILVKPTIIIQREIENRSFPLLQNRVNR